MVLLAGCSSSTRHDTANSHGSAATSRSTTPGRVVAAGTSPSAKAVQTAEEVLAKLRAAKLPIATIIKVTASSDSNHLLGRPNGYTSKITFTDSRLNPADANDPTAGSVDLGGAIESYPDASGATARSAYIQSILKADPMLGTEYDYVVGSSLLRLSALLTPAQVQQYKSAGAQ